MNTILPWRELKRGMDFSDVGAAQRGLWRALGAASTNARNGVYGVETSADVQRFRAMKGMPGSPDIIGGTLWEALNEYFDLSAYVLASNQPPGVTVGPGLKRVPLSKGMTGSDVGAAQRALWRALDGDSTNARNGVYGDQTVVDVRLFRKRFDVNADDASTSIGVPLWNVLTRWFDATAVQMARDSPEPPPPVPVISWLDVAKEAMWCYDNRSRFRYAQLRPMEDIHSAAPVLTDCSGMYTGCCKSAGVPNPNRSDGIYDGYGYTGSLYENGRWTATPRAGDAALYGQPYGSTGHVAVYMGDGSVVSFGHDPIEHYPVRYRSDFLGIRTYRED